MTTFYTAHGVAHEMIPGSGKLAIELVSLALGELTKWCLHYDHAPEFDAGLVIKEVRELNTSWEVKDRIVRLLDQAEFQCRWTLPQYVDQVAGFTLDPSSRPATGVPELPGDDTWEEVHQFTAQGAARFADFLAQAEFGDDEREQLQLSCLATLESKLNGMDAAPLTWEISGICRATKMPKTLVFEASRDDLAIETFDPALIPA